MTKELKWESLERRRETSRLVIFYKSFHGETALPLPYHLVRANGNMRSHSDIFVQVSAKTFVYVNSFNSRTVKYWNGLPKTASTVDTFKIKLGS